MADEKLIEQVMNGVKISVNLKYFPQDNYDFGEIAGVPSPTDPTIKVLALSTPGMYIWQVNPQAPGSVTIKIKILVPSEYAGESGSKQPVITLLGTDSQEKSPTKYDEWEEIQLTANCPENGSMNLEIANMSLHENSFIYVETIEIV